MLAGPVGWSPAFGEGSALPLVGVVGGEEVGAAGCLAAGGAAEACWSSGGCGVDRGVAPLAGTDRHDGLILTGFVTADGHETSVDLGLASFVTGPGHSTFVLFWRWVGAVGTTRVVSLGCVISG